MTRRTTASVAPHSPRVSDRRVEAVRWLGEAPPAVAVNRRVPAPNRRHRFPLSWVLVCLVSALFPASRTSAQQLSREQVQVLRDSVAFVECGDRQGSAFLVYRKDDRGIFVTNAHVVQDKKGQQQPVKLILRSGTRQDEKEAPAKILATDVTNDLAFLEIQSAHLGQPLKLANKPDLWETQDVIVAGYPFGSTLAAATSRPQLSISRGSISSLRRWKLKTPSTIQIDANVNPGNSGGPLIALSGEVIGVVTAKIGGTQLAFASPVSTLRNAIQGAVSTLDIVSMTEEGDSLRLVLDGQLVDPFKRVHKVSIRFLDRAAIERDLSALDQWPPLPSYNIVSTAEIDDQNFAISTTIPTRHIDGDKLYAQFTCERRDGSIFHSATFETLLGRVEPRKRSGDPSPTPSQPGRPREDDKLARIDMGRVPESPSTFGDHDNTPAGSAPAEPPATEASPVAHHMLVRPASVRLATDIQAIPLDKPEHSVLSEAVVHDRWAVRRVLLPPQSLLPSVQWHEKTAHLTCVSADGIYYVLDTVSGRVHQRTALESGLGGFVVNNGTLITYSQRHQDLVLFDLRGQQIRQVVPVPPEVNLLATSAEAALLTSGPAPWRIMLQVDPGVAECAVYVFRTPLGGLCTAGLVAPSADGSVIFGTVGGELCRFERREDHFQWIASKPLKEITTPEFQPHKICWASDGREIAVLCSGVSDDQRLRLSGEVVVLATEDMRVIARHELSGEVPQIAAKAKHDASWFIGGEFRQLWKVGPSGPPKNILLPSTASKVTALAVSPVSGAAAVINADGLFLVEQEEAK